MGRIYCIGETVMDIIFKNNQPVAAKPGGSMLNSAISLGRMQLPVFFISEFGWDNLGDIIDEFIKLNGVDTSYVFRYHMGKTSIAIALLDEKNNARYSFYKDLPSQRLKIEIPLFRHDDYILFGSFYSINAEIRKEVKAIIEKANDAGATIIYDPNFRKAHLHELSDLLPMIIENMKMASIIKASDEDMKMIFNTTGLQESYDVIKKYCSNFIYTKGSEGCAFMNSIFEITLPAKDITPLSTIGAGDSFSAGIITYLYKNNIVREQLHAIDEKNVNRLLQTGIDFATNVCLSYDNYVGNEFAKEYLKALTR